MILFADYAVSGVGAGRMTMRRSSVLIIAAALLLSGCSAGSENASTPISESSAVGSLPEPSNVTSSASSSSSSAVSGSTSEESAPGSSGTGESSVGSSSAVEPPQSSSTASSIAAAPEKPTEKEENDLEIKITINGRVFSATFYDNETARAFKVRLPLSLDMSELNGNEKYYYLSDDLPTAPVRPSKINTGDIMLYGSSCIVIFYESFSTSYSYTPIGKIDDPDGLAAALGSGSVQVTFNAVPNH